MPGSSGPRSKYHAQCSYDDCVIRVKTDEGVTGIGEVESLAAAIQAIVNVPPAHSHARGLRELLIGRDPTQPQDLWERMDEATEKIGSPNF